MIKTLGLTHIALPVKGVKRSSAFYEKVFGAKEMYHDPEFIQVQTPGKRMMSWEDFRRGNDVPIGAMFYGNAESP